MVKDIKGGMGSQENRLLTVVDNRDDTLRMEVLKPKDPLPTSFRDWRENEFIADFKHLNKLDKEDFYK